MEIYEYLFYFAEILDELVVKYGIIGIFLAMMAESAGIPFASALVILTAGKMIASGKITFVGAVAASTIGITAGSLISYFIGFIGRKLGRVINTGLLNGRIKKVPYQMTRLNEYIDKYGNFSIILAQLFGTTRTFISFPAGIMKMNIFLFLIYTTIGGIVFSVGAVTVSILLNQLLRLFWFIVWELFKLPVWIWPVGLVVLILIYLGYRYFYGKPMHGRRF